MLAKYVPRVRHRPGHHPQHACSTSPIRWCKSPCPSRGTDLKYIRQVGGPMAGYTFFVQAGPVPGMPTSPIGGPSCGPTIPFPASARRRSPSIGTGRSNVESLQFGPSTGSQKTQWIVILIQASTLMSFPIPIPVPGINPLSPPLGRKSPVPAEDFSSITGLAKYNAGAGRRARLGSRPRPCRQRHRARPRARWTCCATDRHHAPPAPSSKSAARASPTTASYFVDSTSPHHQTRLLQTELHPQPQRPHRRQRQPGRLPELPGAGARWLCLLGRSGPAAAPRGCGHRHQPARSFPAGSCPPRRWRAGVASPPSPPRRDHHMPHPTADEETP